jgi:GNAT superfamily N-acetyltransferase
VPPRPVARRRNPRSRPPTQPSRSTGAAGDPGTCPIATPSRDEDAGPDTAEIAALYVSPDRWRTGLGSALLDAAVNEHTGLPVVRLRRRLS